MKISVEQGITMLFELSIIFRHIQRFLEPLFICLVATGRGDTMVLDKDLSKTYTGTLKF